MRRPCGGSAQERGNGGPAAWRPWIAGLALLMAGLGPLATLGAQESANQPAALQGPSPTTTDPQKLVEAATGPAGLSSSLQILLLLTVLSLAPAVLLMTTSFVRIVVVLGLLRQAIGTQQLPPSQVITSLALFMTLLIMAPVWKAVYDDAIVPYSQGQIGLEEAWQRGQAPLRRFMSDQIQRTGNDDDVWLFLDYAAPQNESESKPPQYVYYGADPEQGEVDVPLSALLPAFMLSELKTAFLIGFQIYLPFLILDMVIASVLIAMGMVMLPPVVISLPFKLLLFVLVDGWQLVVGMLLESFQPYW
jgi:flagellar biosynthetic protein FliP